MHFTCWTGQCIPFNQRCDAKRDCPDYSDEDHCGQITFEIDKYKKTIVPRSPKGEDHLMIEVELDVSDIVEVNEPKEGLIARKLRVNRNAHKHYL